jgi:hypothetical protein
MRVVFNCKVGALLRGATCVCYIEFSGLLGRFKEMRTTKVWQRSLPSAADALLRPPERIGQLRSPGRNHRGLRHYWGLRIKGQHTKTTGRRGKTVGVAKKR